MGVGKKPKQYPPVTHTHIDDLFVRFHFAHEQIHSSAENRLANLNAI